MKHHLLLVAIIGALWAALCHPGLYSQSSASYPKILYVIYDGAPVYDSADHMSAIVGELRLGDSIQALAASGRYYRIRFGEREGYLYWSNVQPDRPAGGEKRARKARAKQNQRSQGEKAALPLQRSASGGDGDLPMPDSLVAVSSRGTKERAKKGKGAQCQAVTKTGRQCSRGTADSSGYCWQHKK